MLKDEVPDKLQYPAPRVQLKKSFSTERKAQPGQHYHGNTNHMGNLATLAAML